MNSKEMLEMELLDFIEWAKNNSKDNDVFWIFEETEEAIAEYLKWKEERK